MQLQSLEECQELYGETDLRVAHAMSRLAICYQLQGQMRKSDALTVEAHAIIQEAHTVTELQLLRQLMAEGQGEHQLPYREGCRSDYGSTNPGAGIVQQQLDELKSRCKHSTSRLACCRKEIRRQAGRNARLKHKFDMERDEMSAERHVWESDISKVKHWPSTSMRLKMKRDDALKRIVLAYEQVCSR